MPPFASSPHDPNDRNLSFVSNQWSPNPYKAPSHSSSDAGRRSFCTVLFCRTCPPIFSEPEFGCKIIGGKDKAVRQKSSWRSRLLEFSTWASMLCVVDCTILPLLTILFPLLGWMDDLLDESWLDEVGHAVALCVVLPIGALATTTNYCLAHRRLWIACIGWVGMFSIAAANGGCQGIVRVLGDSPVGTTFESFLHMVHHGLAHRAANLTGCALLMSSNYLSKTVPPKQP